VAIARARTRARKDAAAAAMEAAAAAAAAAAAHAWHGTHHGLAASRLGAVALAKASRVASAEFRAVHADDAGHSSSNR
jgi:hypothetical protein